MGEEERVPGWVGEQRERKKYLRKDWEKMFKETPDVDKLKETPIDEETQKEIDKIGVSGKRNIDDLLNAFKMIKNPDIKRSSVEQLGDESWEKEVFSRPLRPDEAYPKEEIKPLGT